MSRIFTYFCKKIIITAVKVFQSSCEDEDEEDEWCQFPHLQPRAELRRNQRGEIGRQHIKYLQLQLQLQLVSQFKKINRQILMHAVKNFNYFLNVNSLLIKDAKECVG